QGHAYLERGAGGDLAAARDHAAGRRTARRVRPIMRRSWRALCVGALAWSAAAAVAPTLHAQVVVTPAPAEPPPRAAIFQRAQRLVNDGNGPEGRALVDSLLNATEPRSAA